jgi:formylglycine-generating enzyme required for sulfatase activity
MVALLVTCLSGVLSLLGWQLRLHPAAHEAAPEAAHEAAIDLKELGARTPEGMALIPQRVFKMGTTRADQEEARRWCLQELEECREDWFTRETQVRTVTVRPFFLDRTEVTNPELLHFLRDSGQDIRLVREPTKKRDYLTIEGRVLLDLNWGINAEPDSPEEHPKLLVPAGWEQRPAAAVTWLGALLYCRWKGKLLPTEAQWEAAARPPLASGEPAPFPWGAARPTCDGVAIAQEVPRSRGPEQGKKWLGALAFRPIGTSPQDRSPEGVLDLAGNVSEWVLDEYSALYPATGSPVDPFYGSPNPSTSPGTMRVRRGGNIYTESTSARSTQRYQEPEQTKAIVGMGIRCALSPLSSASPHAQEPSR